MTCGGDLMTNWIEIGAHNQPETITVNLLEDEEAINITKEAEKTDWEQLFTNQNKDGELMKDYNERMAKVDIPASYDYAVFTNYNPLNIEIETEINGEKIWLDDHPEDRPDSITVYLLANKVLVDEQLVRAENSWKYKFTNLADYDAAGDRIVYSVAEKTIEGYKTSYEGYVITNLRIGTVERNMIKNWHDSENEDRPKKIKVDLLQNGKSIQKVQLSEKTNWSYHFSDLDEFDHDGKAYRYTIKEQIINDYQTSPVKFEIVKDGSPKEREDREARNLGLAIAGGVIVLLGLAAGRKRTKK